MTNKIHGILFSAPMVRALLVGTKTQTRRLITGLDASATLSSSHLAPGGLLFSFRADTDSSVVWTDFKPRYQPGDYLYAKESFQLPAAYNHLKPSEIPAEAKQLVSYVADGHEYPNAPKRPSMFMPRHLSRIYLRVLEVRAEKLLDISADDAIDEGIEQLPNGLWRNYHHEGRGFSEPTDSYISLVETLHNMTRRNPWMWAYTFERVEALPE